MPRPFPAGHVFPMATLAAFQVQLTVISRAFSKGSNGLGPVQTIFTSANGSTGGMAGSVLPPIASGLFRPKLHTGHEPSSFRGDVAIPPFFKGRLGGISLRLFSRCV